MLLSRTPTRRMLLPVPGCPEDPAWRSMPSGSASSLRTACGAGSDSRVATDRLSWGSSRRPPAGQGCRARSSSPWSETTWRHSSMAQTSEYSRARRARCALFSAAMTIGLDAEVFPVPDSNLGHQPPNTFQYFWCPKFESGTEHCTSTNGAGLIRAVMCDSPKRSKPPPSRQSPKG
eukprot:SAG31_NODE_5030_length_2793_cov_1.858575_5_plen_176_part_00